MTRTKSQSATPGAIEQSLLSYMQSALGVHFTPTVRDEVSARVHGFDSAQAQRLYQAQAGRFKVYQIEYADIMADESIVLNESLMDDALYAGADRDLAFRTAKAAAVTRNRPVIVVNDAGEQLLIEDEPAYDPGYNIDRTRGQLFQATPAVLSNGIAERLSNLAIWENRKRGAVAHARRVHQGLVVDAGAPPGLIFVYDTATLAILLNLPF